DLLLASFGQIDLRLCLSPLVLGLLLDELGLGANLRHLHLWCRRLIGLRLRHLRHVLLELWGRWIHRKALGIAEAQRFAHHLEGLVSLFRPYEPELPDCLLGLSQHLDIRPKFLAIA